MSYCELRLAPWTKNITPSAMQNTLRYAANKDFISFALGLPDEATFPAEQIKTAIFSVLENDKFALQYTPPLDALKIEIQQIMRLRGLDCQLEEIFLTSGAQQGLNILTRLFIEPHDSVIVESFLYPGFLQAVEPFQPKFLTVRSNGQKGLFLNELEDMLEKGNHNPKLLYVIPDGHNPLAAVLSAEDRVKLSSLAEKYQLAVIEDDPYGMLYYDYKSPKPLKHYLPEQVCYVGTFSKILGASLRIGWIIAPSNLHSKLAILKEGSDLNTATLSHKAAAKLLPEFDFISHVENLRQTYRKKRDWMCSCLDKYFARSINYAIPNCGLFIWVDFMSDINTLDLFYVAVEKYNVAFIDGQSFAIEKNGSGKNSVRINFTNASFDEIEKGVCRLKDAYLCLLNKNNR